MLLSLLNLFCLYLLVSIVFRILLSIIPGPIRDGFGILGKFRQISTRLVISVYRKRDNFEVNLLAIFILPFVVLMSLYVLGSTLVILNPSGTYINIWIIIALVFLISFIAPTTEDMQLMREVTASSVFLFVFKVFIIIQLIADQIGGLTNFHLLVLFLLPISPYLESSG